jgi:hypothetical protein
MDSESEEMSQEAVTPASCRALIQNSSVNSEKRRKLTVPEKLCSSENSVHRIVMLGSMSVCLSVYVCMYVCIYLSIYLYIYLSIYLCIYLPTWNTPRVEKINISTASKQMTRIFLETECSLLFVQKPTTSP